MNIISYTSLVQIIMSIIGIVQVRNLEKNPNEVLFCHEKKSHSDSYKTVQFSAVGIIIVIGTEVINQFNEWTDISTIIKMSITLVVYILVAIIILFLTAFYVYMITEVKHLSLEDEIGKKIQKLEAVERRNAYLFFKTEVVFGVILLFNLLVQMFCLNFIYGIMLICAGGFVFYFGMADVLQHPNYNSEEYKKEFRKKTFTDKYFINNIMRFFCDEVYRAKSKNVLQTNIKNIRQGFCRLFERR